MWCMLYNRTSTKRPMQYTKNAANSIPTNGPGNSKKKTMQKVKNKKKNLKNLKKIRKFILKYFS